MTRQSGRYSKALRFEDSTTSSGYRDGAEGGVVDVLRGVDRPGDSTPFVAARNGRT